MLFRIRKMSEAVPRVLEMTDAYETVITTPEVD
jgi:hypothetical protein